REARLVLAQADLASGAAGAARQAARSARQQFVRQHRVGWARLARYVELRAAEALGSPAPALLRAALACADELAAAGWSLSELDCRLTAAAAALRAGEAPRARAQLARAASARRAPALEVRSRATSLRLQPARPPADAGLAAALAEVRRLSAETRAAQLAGRSPTALAGQLRAAEERVRDASRATESPFHRGGSTPPTVAELTAALGERVLVE